MYLLVVKDDNNKVVHHEEFDNEDDMQKTVGTYSQLAMYIGHTFYETEILSKGTKVE